MSDTPNQSVGSEEIRFVMDVFNDLDALEAGALPDEAMVADAQMLEDERVISEDSEPRAQDETTASSRIGRATLRSEIDGSQPIFQKPKSSPKQTTHRPSRNDDAQPEEDNVRLYLSDIGRSPLLTKHGEAVLNIRHKRGLEAVEKQRVAQEEGRRLSTAERREIRHAIREGEEAEKTFITANLRLVVSIAKKYQASGMPLLDLIQEGNLGLIHALGKFDHTKGFKFSTYATWWVRQAITRGIANTGRTIRLPVHASEDNTRVLKSQTKLHAAYGREPTLRELAEDLDLPEDKVNQILSRPYVGASFSDAVGDDGEAELGDFIADQSAVDPAEAAIFKKLPEEVEKMLENLDDREREIVRQRFGLDRGEARSLEDVAKEYGMTRERIRQIEARAIAKLRHPVIAANFQGLRDE